jgi:hypothetical protein
MIGILRASVPKARATTPSGEVHVRAGETTPSGDENVRWVVIAIVSWAEAEVMRSKLESAGIPCLLQRESAGAVIGITIGPLGEVRVLVPEPLADRAVELLSEDVEDLGEDVSEGEEDQDAAADVDSPDDQNADTSTHPGA